MTKRLLISNVAVVVLLVVGVGYVSIALAKVNPARHPFTVTVVLEKTGGLYENSEVTFLGDPVGDVVSITPHAGAVSVKVDIDPDVKIPRDTAVVVSGLSPVGEQYLDFRPRTADGPYLADGDRVDVDDTATPVEFPVMMRHVAELAAMIRPRDIRTVVDELATALGDPRTDPHRLVLDAETLLDALREVEPDTVRLLDRGEVVLGTAVDLSPELRQFSRSARQLTRDLRDGTAAWKTVLTASPHDLQRIADFIEHDLDSVPGLLDNGSALLTVLADRGPALSTLLQVTAASADQVASTAPNGWIRAVLSLDVGADLCRYTPADVAAPWIPRRPVVDYSRHCATYSPGMQQRGSYYAPRYAGPSPVAPRVTEGGTPSGRTRPGGGRSDLAAPKHSAPTAPSWFSLYPTGIR